jgi:hypothetical protein
LNSKFNWTHTTITPALKLKKKVNKILTLNHKIDSRKQPCTNTLVREQSRVLTRLLCKQKKRGAFVIVVYNPLTAAVKVNSRRKSSDEPSINQ